MFLYPIEEMEWEGVDTLFLLVFPFLLIREKKKFGMSSTFSKKYLKKFVRVCIYA